jgi:hypothetical protein
VPLLRHRAGASHRHEKLGVAGKPKRGHYNVGRRLLRQESAFGVVMVGREGVPVVMVVSRK